MKKLTALLLALVLVLSLLPLGSFAFNAENYRPNITKITVGKPLTGSDGKKYIPVDVNFTCEENPDDNGAFLEGVVKAVHDGATHAVAGVGMTLRKVSGTPGNNEFKWDKNTKSGVARFNVPVLDKNDSQTVEHSNATGQDEVNGVKPDNTVKIRLETYVQGYPDPISSNEKSFVYDPSGAKEKVSLSKIKISKTKASKNSVTVKWKKLSKTTRKKVKKIQVEISKDKNFKKDVISKTISSGKTSAKFSGLEKGQKYYVRVRAYTQSGSVINVSKWTKKTVKTKK